MKGYKVAFNIYASSQEEADALSNAIGSFVDSYAKRGVAVTAYKLESALKKWGDNPIVRSFFK